MYHSSRDQFLHANYHFVLSKNACKNPAKWDEIVSLAYECDEMCSWSTILDVHMFADDSFTCPICLSRPIAPVAIPCGHVFCWACILRHVSYASHACSTCPLCSKMIRVETCKPVKLLKPIPSNAGSKVEMTLLRRKHGSAVAFPASKWNSYMRHLYSAENRNEIPLPDRERDGPACIFSRYSVSDDGISVTKRQLRELRRYETECISEGDEESLVFVRRAIEISLNTLKEYGVVDDGVLDEDEEKDEIREEDPTAAKTVMVPQSEDGEVNDAFYYQANNGQPIFLDLVDLKMMMSNAKKHGSMLPTMISATVLENKESVLEYGARKRFRKFAFVPVGTSLSVVELDMKGLVDASTYKEFAATLQSREAFRKKQEAKRREEERLASVPLCKTVHFTDADFMPLPVPTRPPEMNDASFPTLESSASSPSLSPPPCSVSAPLETKLSYAEIARIAVESSKPLSISEESDFPSLSGSTSLSTPKSKIVWGPQSRKNITPAVLTRSSPKSSAPAKTERPSTTTTTTPASSEKLDTVISQQPVVEEAFDGMEGGHMVMVSPKKGAQPNTRNRNKKKKK